MNATSPTAETQLYDRPVLVVDPGMHTATINAAGVDAAGTLAVTGSDDKTVRVWSLPEGKLLQTIRIPAGPGNIGKIYSVAMSPDGDLMAAVGGQHGQEIPKELLFICSKRTGAKWSSAFRAFLPPKEASPSPPIAAIWR
jgi:WD40 repeat protein